MEMNVESLDFEEDFPVSPPGREEIQQRCEAIDNGEVERVPIDETLKNLPLAGRGL